MFGLDGYLMTFAAIRLALLCVAANLAAIYAAVKTTMKGD